jgi:hypothetical protein
MDKHVCKQCGKLYNYCRSCLLKPIPFKAAGFCSKECSAEFKKPKIEEVIQEDVEVVVPVEDTPTSEKLVAYPYFFVEEVEVKEEIEEDGDKQSNGEEL